MTVVAYRDGVLASDSAASEGDTIAHGIKKIYRVRGNLIGCAGYLSDISKFINWFRAGGEEDEFPKMKDLSALMVSREGNVYCYDHIGPTPTQITSSYCATGSGMQIALGAMYAGADAVQAVKAAIKHNGGCAGPVRTLRLRNG